MLHQQRILQLEQVGNELATTPDIAMSVIAPH